VLSAELDVLRTEKCTDLKRPESSRHVVFLQHIQDHLFQVTKASQDNIRETHLVGVTPLIESTKGRPGRAAMFSPPATRKKLERKRSKTDRAW
jgi:hypothetical protein